MIRIGLFCAAGMSTSLLVQKMKKIATQKNISVEIEAYPESEMTKRVDEIDVALLGPQLKYMINKAKGICEPKGVPIEVINTVDYGMMNGEKVLDTAIKLAQK